jgi:ribonuclease HI
MKSKFLFYINEKIVVYTDGGSRGNPGPAAFGVIIGDSSTALVAYREYGEYLGEKTNNYAEYYAAVFALKKIKQLIGKKKTKESEVEVRMDSELVVKQLNGEYKILEKDLQPLFLEIWNLKLDFKKVEFVYIPREKNKKADRIVNQVLDQHGK